MPPDQIEARSRRTRCAWAAMLLLSACAANARWHATATPTPPPDLRHGHGLARTTGAWLAVGGFAHRGSAPDRGTSGAYLLRDEASTWRATAPLPVGKAFFALVESDAGILALGNDAQRFDAAAETWQRIAPTGTLPNSHFAACRHAGAIFVLGGYPAERGSLRSIDPRTGEVRLAPPLPGMDAGDHFHLLASLADGLHVVGGYDGENFVPQSEHHVFFDGAWQQLPAPPTGMWAKFAAHGVIDGRWLIFGEFGGWQYAPKEGWRSAAPLPRLLAMPASAVVDGRLWVVGGMDVEAPGQDVLFCYDPSTDRWTAPPHVRTAHSDV